MIDVILKIVVITWFALVIIDTILGYVLKVVEKMASEKRFETKVKEFLTDRKCWWLKTWSNGIQRKGVPDLLVCCNGFFIGIELKAATGNPSDLQKREIKKIRKAGGISMILYPDQFEQFKMLIDDLLEVEVDKHINYRWIFEQF